MLEVLCFVMVFVVLIILDERGERKDRELRRKKK